MNLPDSPVAELSRPAAAMKFSYPSGSRPLDGYTIKRGVGRGGFGEVYFATSDAGKEVALKLIRRNMDVELRGATQCLNLKHPNLIGLYDIRTDEMGDQWIIMEYVSGESLEDAIERYPQGMPIDQVLFWMRGLCAGVGYLHDHGIVHRDLKPGNIFLDEGTVKIGDYGLAKFISCSRRSGQTESVGTVHYMAPEIANGRYGREIDTYALGVILFEMLTGTVPFEGESVGEVLMKHLTAEPDLSRLDEPYRDIVRRALTKDPEVRLKNVGELLALMPGGSSPSDNAGLVHDDIVLTPIDSPAAGSPRANAQPFGARPAHKGSMQAWRPAVRSKNQYGNGSANRRRFFVEFAVRPITNRGPRKSAGCGRSWHSYWWRPRYSRRRHSPSFCWALSVTVYITRSGPCLFGRVSSGKRCAIATRPAATHDMRMPRRLQRRARRVCKQVTSRPRTCRCPPRPPIATPIRFAGGGCGPTGASVFIATWQRSPFATNSASSWVRCC